MGSLLLLFTHTHIVITVDSLTCALTYFLFCRILFKYGIYLYFHDPYIANHIICINQISKLTVVLNFTMF